MSIHRYDTCYSFRNHWAFKKRSFAPAKKNISLIHAFGPKKILSFSWQKNQTPVPCIYDYAGCFSRRLRAWSQPLVGTVMSYFENSTAGLKLRWIFVWHKPRVSGREYGRFPGLRKKPDNIFVSFNVGWTMYRKNKKKSF